MDRQDVIARIAKLKAEIERLGTLAAECRPPVSNEIRALAEEMSSHVTVLEGFLARTPEMALDEAHP